MEVIHINDESISSVLAVSTAPSRAHVANVRNLVLFETLIDKDFGESQSRPMPRFELVGGRRCLTIRIAVTGGDNV